MRRLAPAAVALAALLLVGACSRGGDDSDTGANLGVTQPPTTATVPDALAPSKAGTGVVSIAGSASSFAVETCQLATTTDSTGLQTLVHVTGTGTTGSGTPFEVEIVRFASGTDIKTYTDTVTYTDSARVLQAQRYEVNGQVNDLRDPNARSSMVRARPGGVAAQGLAGPPGATAKDEGVVGLAIDATCKA